jgi:hypothetical protein
MPSNYPPPGPNAFTPSDCVSAPSGNATLRLADAFQVVVQQPAGWTQETPDWVETPTLLLKAPSNYSNAPTRIGIQAGMEIPNSWTPDQVAARYYGPVSPGVDPDFEAHLVGDVAHCTVAGHPAAFFQYTSKRSHLPDGRLGEWTGYLVVFVHDHVPYNIPYALRIEGSGGIDPRAIHDAKVILGSWTWTVSTSPSK